MNVPLYVNKFEYFDKSKLSVWVNKKRYIRDIPFKPYFYDYKLRNIPAKIVPVKIKRLSDLQIKHAYKYSFSNINDIRIFRTETCFEADIPYIQRVAIDLPDYYTQFHQDNNLDILYFDIETDTVGVFPNPKRNIIIAIAYAINDNPVQVLTIDKLERGDKELLLQFLDVIKDVNPDVLVGYNLEDFDIPYIIDRLIINGLSTQPLTRENKEAYFMMNDNRIVNIRGRCVFDVFLEVLKDQTLYGISQRKLKDVAEWFHVEKMIRQDPQYSDYKIIREEVGNMRELIGSKRLEKYVISDVLITRALSNLYFKNILKFAQMFKLPLNMVLHRTMNLLGTITYARELKKQNIVSDSPNYKRFPSIYGKLVPHPKKINKMIFEGGTKFQGAIVDIYRKGVIENLYKIDYVGMYGNIIAMHNLSPETTKIIGFRSYGKFKVEKRKNEIVYYIPDNRIDKNVIIRVDMSKEGFLPRQLKMFQKERNKIKLQLKDPKLPKYKREELISDSWCMKVYNASAYGVNGSPFFRYGETAISIATTGLGRFYNSFITDKMGTRKIENDTDGLIVEGEVDIDKINKDLQKHIQKTFGLSPLLFLEREGPFKKGYFFKQKNYILLDKYNNLIKHGAVFKGSSKNKIFTIALHNICKSMLIEPEKLKDTIDKSFHFENNIDGFVMRTKINKPLSEYVNTKKNKKGCLQYQVGIQAQELLGMKVNVGDMLEYVKQTDGYKIRQFANINKIDTKYYYNQIKKVLKRLGLTKYVWSGKEVQIQKSLTDFACVGV